MNQVLINPATEKQLLSIAKNLPQSILINAQSGMGGLTIAKYLANLCEIPAYILHPEKDEKIDIEKGIVGVEIIRGLIEKTRTKSPHKRMFIIDQAEKMNTPAQNAFLKLLEEPTEGVYLILVSNTTNNFLPTILSRVNKIDIKPINKTQTEQLISELKIDNNTKKSQILFMANGLPAEINRLVGDTKYFEIRSEKIRDAREMIIGSQYSKMKIAQKYKDDRSGILLLLSDILKILKQSITANPQPEILTKINSVIDCYQKIEANGNIRICLAKTIF